MKYVQLWEEEKFGAHRNEYLISDNMLPVRKHQIFEEILQFQKEFAGMIYFQRCKERLNY